MRLSFKVALRFLSSSKAQTFLIALGIGIGISVQIFIGALIEGLQVSLIDATIGSASHLTLANPEKNESVKDTPNLLKNLIPNENGIKVVSENLTQGGFIKLDDDFTQVLIRGFDIKKANEIYKFSDALRPKSILPKGNEVLIGKVIADDNKIVIGDTITLASPQGNTVAVLVSGVFDLKVDAINSSWVIGDLTLVRELFKYEASEVTSIEMQVFEPFEVETTALALEQNPLLSPYKLSTWKEANAQLLSGLMGQSTSSYMIQVFVIISVVLGIASVLAITVLQKSRQLGILKAMGITNFNASLVFLFQGLLLGVLGGFLGLLIGIGLLYAFQTFALNPDGTPVVPVIINWRFMTFSGLLAVFACTLAAIIPARKSKKLSPIEVIRNG